MNRCPDGEQPRSNFDPEKLKEVLGRPAGGPTEAGTSFELPDLHEDTWHYNSGTPYSAPNPRSQEPTYDPKLVQKGAAAIEADAQEYLMHREHLLRQAVTPIEYLPDDAVGIHPDHRPGYIAKDPFNSYFLKLQALRREGYAVYLSDDALDVRDRPEPSGLAMRVKQADAAAVRAADNVFNDVTNRNPFAALLISSTDPWGVYRFSPDDYYHADLSTGLAQELPSDQAELLLQQGLATAIILGNVYISVNPGHELFTGGTSQEKAEFAVKYSELSGQGIRPFNIEQLHGLASRAVRQAIRENDIPPPASRRNQGGEIGGFDFSGYDGS